MPVVALYRRGEAWDDAKPLGEQPALPEHIDFLVELERRGVAVQAGPFHRLSSLVGTDPVGLVVFATADVDEARKHLADDPAITNGALECDLLPWYA